MGLPGTVSSGCETGGTILSSGCRVQEVRPARAHEAAINFRNSRRLDPSGHVAAPAGNSE
jgi:hypothetical protein